MSTTMELRAAPPSPVRRPPPVPVTRIPVSAPAAGPKHAAPHRRRWWAGLPLLAAIGCWIAALATSDLSHADQFGLLGTISPAYHVGLGLLLIGFVLEFRHASPLLGAHVVALVVMLHATVPALSPLPEYAWTYKHVGVVNLFLEQGRIIDQHDIYQLWPTLFSFVADLSALTGVDPLQLARWEPLAANLLFTLVTFAIVRQLTGDPRRRALTVLVATVINLPGQYLSPQDFAWLLALGMFLLLLLGLRSTPVGGLVGNPVRRLWSVVVDGVEPGRSGQYWFAIGGMVLLFAVQVSAHQLSPYLVLIDLVALAFFGLLRPRWLVALLGVVAIAYFLPRAGYVASTYNLFSADVVGNASGTSPSWATAGQAFSAVMVRGMMLGSWGLGLVALWFGRHRLRALALPGVLAYAPFLLLMANSYGGEAIYRVWLFSSLWVAYLITDLVLHFRWPRWVGMPGGVVALALAVTAMIQGAHGQLMIDYHAPSEVAAARYLYANAPAGSTFVLGDVSFSGRSDGDYNRINVGYGGDPDLVTGLKVPAGGTLDDLAAIRSYVTNTGGTAQFLVITDNMADYAHYFGHLRDGSLQTLRSTLEHTPGWTVFYSGGGVEIFQVTPLR